MPSAHSAESPELSSSDGRSNDESLHPAHSRNPHQLSSGAAPGYGQQSCNTVPLHQIPSDNSTQYSASLYPGQTQSTHFSQPLPAGAVTYFPPLNLPVTLPQMPAPHSVPLQIMVQPYVGVGNVPQLNISISNLPPISSTVPQTSLSTWSGQPQIQYQPPSEPALVNVPQFPDRSRLDQVQSGSRFGYTSTSAYPGQTYSTESRSFDTAIGNGQQSYDSSVPIPIPNSRQEQQHTSQSLKSGPVSTSEICTCSGSGRLQSTQLPSFRSVFGSPMLSSRLLSTNETDYLAPRDMTLSSKRTANAIYPSGSELNSSGQSVTALTFEDTARPRKRMKESDIASTSYVPEERIQSLAVTANYHDPRIAETFPVDGCRLSHDQLIDIPVQRSMDSKTRNDISMFRDTQGFTIGGNPTFTNIGVKQVTNCSGSHDLEILKIFVSFNALHDSSIQDPDRRCHPGTRVNVLARLQGWMDDPSASERIVWLHGLPGAGKSSIAQTIIRLCGREKVAASFFFYRSDPSRNDGNRLFTTIAWQLASSIPNLKGHLVNALTQRPDLPMKDVETQFEELIIQPFHALNDAASHLELPLAPVVVIDGVDECTDEELQRRFLNVIGNAIRNRRVPLRFLIVSRPEAHIKETVDQFKCPALCIDLGIIDNANHDIKSYFDAEFSRIADDRNFDMTWPGHCIIQELVRNSCGQFVYAATVIRYVGDPYNCAKAQLDIILGLKKRPSASLFASLDELYTEILKRQLDPEFLKGILALLVACSSMDFDYELHADFPMLLNVSEEEMGRKLRGMRSLLAFEKDYIHIHHRSFLDFLRDKSRSGQYHINERASSRRYLELITDTIIRYISVLIDQSQCHNTQHLHLKYSFVSSQWPLEPSLAVEDLREILQPLVDLQDELLNLPNFNPSTKLPPCDKCNVFELMRNLLLHLALSQATSYYIASSTSGRVTGSPMFEQEGDYITIAALPKIDVETNFSDNDLDRNFTSLLAYMRNTPSSSPTVYVLELMDSLLRFDCVEIAKKFCSVLDAQNMVNLIDYAIHGQNSINMNGGMNLSRKAFHLVREINARVPVLPQSLLLYENPLDMTVSIYDGLDNDFDIEDLCAKGLMCRLLDLYGNFTDPTRLILYSGQHNLDDLCWDIDCYGPNHIDIYEWCEEYNPSHGAMFQVMLELSKCFQYIHSAGLCAPDVPIRHISMNSEFSPKLPKLCLYIKDEVKYTYEHDVFTFGRLFYEIYFNTEVPYTGKEFKRDTIVKRPPVPEIHEDAWQLIQRCCAKDPESRPTIDEVVQEMESWEMESESLSSIDDRKVVPDRESLGIDSETFTPVSSSSQID